MTRSLSPQLTREVLAYLQVSAAQPNLQLLNTIIAAYGRSVPWESASRIAKRASIAQTADCPRWSDEFWHDAIRFGTGGTCFESNRAFLALLNSLGYDGYLTLNNMHDTIGCHSAIVVRSGADKWLVDAGYPIYTALRLDPEQAATYHTPYCAYTVRPLSSTHYLLETTPHAKPYMFDLHDIPIDDETYRRATTHDYGDQGLFLDRLVIRKIVSQQSWRFDSAEQPYQLQTFIDGRRIDRPITEDIATALSAHFGIAQPILAAAFASLSRKSNSSGTASDRTSSTD